MKKLFYTGSKVVYKGIICMVVRGINPKAIIKAPRKYKIVLIPMSSNDDIGLGCGGQVMVSSSNRHLRHEPV